MKSFKAATGSGDDWLSACDDCLSTLGGLPPEVNFGVVYAGRSIAHALDLIATRLKDVTGVDTWVGTGGSAVFNHAQGGFRDETISILTGALPADGFRLFDGLADFSLGDAKSSPQHDEAATVAIVHGDPRQVKAPLMIEELAQNSGAFLVGGMTSSISNGAMQIAGRPTEGGLSGVLLSADIPVISGITQGCTPIGPVRTVSGIDGPWITKLDGDIALACLKDDIGPVLARGLERIAGFVFAARPEGEDDRSGYLVRDIVEVDPVRGFLMVGDDLRKGDRLCFVKRDPEGARADLRRLAKDLKGRAENRSILGALYHSCIGRGRQIFGTDDAEFAIIEEELGSLPLAGFQTNGEIFRNRIYGYSAVLTLFLDGE